MEELFSKSVSVAVKSSDRDERQIAIGITVLLNVVTSPVHKKELLVRLTEERDPFFLFTLALGEEDFQCLKSQQGLLVDFSAFPQKFIDLLELCLAESDKDNPKFLLHLVLSPSDRGVSVLNVVETNPFRHLNHLSLKFVPASDTYLKKYLAECLQGLKTLYVHVERVWARDYFVSFRTRSGSCTISSLYLLSTPDITHMEENAYLSEQLTATKSDLSAQLAQSEEALGKRNHELERLKSDWSSHTATLSNEHLAQVTAERERAVQAQGEAQRRFEQERKEAEQAYLSRVEGLESQLRELDASNKELTDHKYRSEAAIRELKAKLRMAEEECVTLRQEVGQLRRDNSALGAASHEHEKTTHQLRTRVAVLEQELQDKEQVISRTSELLDASSEQRKSCEQALEQRHRQISKLDTAFKSASQEVMKGNEIIQKLQGEIRGVKSKLKLKNMVTTQQEKLLGEKDVVLERQKHEIRVLNEALTQKQEDVRKLEESLESSKQKLEESRELLKTNENVISWLNKQMNEQMMGAGGRGHRLPFPTDTLSSIRPSPPLPRPPPLISASLPSHQQLQFSSTPTGVPGAQRQVLGSLASQENVKQQVVFRAPVKKSGIPVPSPLSTHATKTNTTPLGGSSPSLALQNPHLNEEGLDPKYLALQPPASTGNASHSSVTPGVVRPQLRGEATTAGGGQVPLLSAYFPKS